MAEKQQVPERNYCTYFDQGFLIQGLAMWRSLRRNDAGALLWVLALDDPTAGILRRLEDPRLKVVDLVGFEAGDKALAAAKDNRSRVEYYFTLSPCWPLWLLQRYPEIEQVTYLDADLFVFAPLEKVWAEMEGRRASVMLTAHRFAPVLKRYEKHGVFNVGILSFRRDEIGLACLTDWRSRCLDWCYDRLEEGKYADQKYLEAWPRKWGESVWVCKTPGVNAAPWNWTNHRATVAGGSVVAFEGGPLVIFHFARLRPIFGMWWWQSGQIEYGVMPWGLRQAIYGPYGLALEEARASLREIDPEVDFNRRGLRLNRRVWQELPMRLLFGGDWLRLGETWVSGRLGLGRYSGRFLAFLRRMVFRK